MDSTDEDEYCSGLGYNSSGIGSDYSSSIRYEDSIANDSINSLKDQGEDKKYPFEVLTTNQILQHMNDFLKDVNTVVMVRLSIIISLH